MRRTRGGGNPGGAAAARGRERRRFAWLSAFAWGLATLLTAACAAAFLLQSERSRRYFGWREPVVSYQGPWHRPSFVETRTCFNELVICDTRGELKLLLSAELLEVGVELGAWASTSVVSGRDVGSNADIVDHTLTLRSAGYFADLFRAACVLWLAAPDLPHALARGLRCCLRPSQESPAALPSP